MSPRILLPLLSAAGLLALALTGCSTGALPGSSASGAASASAGPSAAPASAPFSVPKDCPPSAEVAGALGISAPPTPTTTATSNSLTCVYLSPTQDGVIIDIEPTTLTSDAFLAGLAGKSSGGLDFAAVTGVGDAAVSITKGGATVGIRALKGSSTIDIESADQFRPSLSGLETLAKKLMGS